LTSTIVGGEWSATFPGRFIPRERAHSIHWIGGCTGLRGGLNAVKKNKKLAPARNRTPAIQLISSIEIKTPVNSSKQKFYEEFSGK
jgi:hypothetical protein